MSQLTASELTLDTVDITDPDRYAAHGYPWEDYKFLRQNAPIHWYEKDYLDPFWAFTKQQEIHYISRHPNQFVSSQRDVIAPRGEEYPAGEGEGPMIRTDPPDHATKRNLISRLFTPKALREKQPRIRELADMIVDGLIAQKVDPATGEGECDFVTEVSALLPLFAIIEMVGAPFSDAQKLFDWMNQSLGAADPEYQGAGDGDGIGDNYMLELMEPRRENPQDDIISLLLHAEYKGARPSDQHITSELGLLFAGGIETTRNAISGGLLALMERPDQYEQLRGDLTLIPSATEEFLRWTTPIIHFARTCVEDHEVGGQLIRKGEHVAMWYASANRDEDVFENPEVFDIRRHPNEHSAFGGFGEHYCLGANLARTEIWEMLNALMTRFEWFEPAGDVQRLRSPFIGGIKHLPVRFKVKA